MAFFWRLKCNVGSVIRETLLKILWHWCVIKWGTIKLAYQLSYIILL